MRVGVLSPQQALGARPSTFIAKEDAAFLVHRMAAEKISNKVIRLFAPDSPFRAIKPARNSYVPAKLPSAEMPGLRFAHASMRRPMSAIRGELGTVYIPTTDTMSLCVNYFAGL